MPLLQEQREQSLETHLSHGNFQIQVLCKCVNPWSMNASHKSIFTVCGARWCTTSEPHETQAKTHSSGVLLDPHIPSIHLSLRGRISFHLYQLYLIPFHKWKIRFLPESLFSIDEYFLLVLHPFKSLACLDNL